MNFMRFGISFSSGTTTYYFQKKFSELDEVIQNRKSVFITDEHVFALYPHYFENRQFIVIQAGEQTKTWSSVQTITEQLIKFEADRKTLLIGVGGGMITDITGFAASIYMRGVSFGFVPTSLLAMVDASIGGKNGINFGLYKNMLGVIRQPVFIFYDVHFLETLADEEWSNGFAEIIKYGCIFDSNLFSEVSDHNIEYYKKNTTAIQSLIQKCVDWKNKTVVEDEHEKGTRKLLNFGHTVGHAIENRIQLSHGYAVSIGMMVASVVSESVTGFRPEMTELLKKVLQQYNLPTQSSFSTNEIMEVLKMDKKRDANSVDYILLKTIGRAVIKNIPFETIQQALDLYNNAGNH